MNRTDKATLIDRMHDELSGMPHLVLASYRGLTVNQANELRRKIGEVGGRYRVIKNRLARRAAEGTPAAAIAERFRGPCGLAGHASDPIALAKVLSEFAKQNPQVELLAGVVDAREALDAASVKQLASLPGLPELRAQLLAMIQTPATTLVRLLQTPGGQLARVVDARREALGGGGSAEPADGE